MVAVGVKRKESPCKKNIKNVGKSVSECVSNVLKKTMGKKLGQGEQGVVYVLDDLVLKVTSLKQTSEDVWFRETCLSERMGDLKIGPKIHGHFVCNDNGYIVMDRLTPIGSKMVKSKKEAKEMVRKKGKEKEEVILRYKWYEDDMLDFLDDLSMMSDKEQKEFVRVFERMVENDYVHMDNHLDNIGYESSSHKAIAYDFGFTQHREGMTKKEKEWALCFTMFQLLEHCRLDIIESTVFYRVATALMNDTYEWGKVESGRKMSLSELFGYIKKMSGVKEGGDALSIVEKLIEKKKGGNNKNYDMFIGSVCYGLVLRDEKKERDNDLMDLIYLIRNPKSSVGKVAKGFYKMIR